MSEHDTTPDADDDDVLDVEPEELKDLDPSDADDVKGGGGVTSGRCM